MEGLSEILQVMRAFRDGTLTATEFAERYSALWDDLVREQDAAIARHPTVGRTLQELSEQHKYGEMTTERYAQRAHEQYALLQGLRLPPGGEASRILGHVFVEADAYRDDVDEPDGTYVTAEELREEVGQALRDLEAG